ncbi:MAG: hypothetical protein OEQ13_01545 [Acidobacteriota bacterium]|nr:hypothetical protein [Acidobacteriota bacterium]
MSRSGQPTTRRTDAYFTASFEVARRLAAGRGDEAIELLRRELKRVQDVDEVVGQRFLLSQIAVCHARMGNVAAAREVLEEMDRRMPLDVETGLMLAEGYLHLVEDPERASHHAALALQWTEEQEQGYEAPETLSRAQALLARAMLASNDMLGALGAWQASPLPSWRVAIELIEAGADSRQIRVVLIESIPRHVEFELRQGASAVASSDQIKRLISWIDDGCPRISTPST